ncbi:MAG: hypothetical protein DSY58_02755 [Desulfobulbus sp.]|nr:MAG: hypothetical protein DSY58_02755 [Desulfobulbus sp.]
MEMRGGRIMGRGLCIFFLVTLLAGLPFNSAQGQEKWTVVTEELPPFNFVHDGEVRGFSTDILLRILHKNNIPISRKSIRLLPWPRAYKLARERAGAILYSTARTKEREELFKWVGPITDVTSVLIARKDRKINIHSLADLSPYTIGTIRDSVPDQFLRKNGISRKNLDGIASAVSNIKKLQSGRIDLLAFSVSSAWFLMKQMNIDRNGYDVVFTLNSNPLYYAFNAQTDNSLISALNATLQEMKKPDSTGKSIVEQIIDKYR